MQRHTQQFIDELNCHTSWDDPWFDNLCDKFCEFSNQERKYVWNQIIDSCQQTISDNELDRINMIYIRLEEFLKEIL